MTKEQYRALRNYLQGIACTVNIYSKEYANLSKRIRIINSKI